MLFLPSDRNNSSRRFENSFVFVMLVNRRSVGVWIIVEVELGEKVLIG